MQTLSKQTFTNRFSNHVLLWLELGCIVDPLNTSIYNLAITSIRQNGIKYTLNEAHILSIKDWQRLSKSYFKIGEFHKLK